MPSLAGAIDLGSNSLKYAIAELDAGDPKVLEQAEVLTRIGERVGETRAVSPAAVARTLEALEGIKARFDARGVTAVLAVATAGLRGVTNAEQVLAPARRLGFEIRIIDGLREAELTFVGPARAAGPAPVAVFDVGGRSTEVVAGAYPSMRSRVSLPIGSVALTERFLGEDPPSPASLDALRTHIREVLEPLEVPPPEAELVGVAGTVLAIFGRARGLGTMAEVIARADGSRVERAEVEDTMRTLAALPAENRRLGDVIPPLRADVIVAGTAIVCGLLERLGRASFSISTMGVRYGLLVELANRRDR